METLSVCSGIGAPEASGKFHPVGMCEIEDRPRSVLKRHFPGVEIHRDLSDRSWWKQYEGVECLIGGTPCQSFSVAGKMEGIEDERGNLTLSFLHLVGTIRPRFVVWENVPGVLTRKMRPFFDMFVGELGRLGYKVEHEIINAQYFGVPQHRKRVFVVASPGGIGLADSFFVKVPSSVADILEDNPPEKYNLSARAAAGVLRRRDKFKSKPLPPVLRQALEDVAEGRELGEGGLHLPSMSNGEDVVPTIPAHGGGYSRPSSRSWNGDPLMITPAVAPALTSRGHGFKDNSIHARTVPPYLVTPTLTASANGFAKCGVEARSTPPFIVTGDDRDIAMTLTYNNTGRITSRYGKDNIIAEHRRLRRFTPTECERLMGFPDGWTATDCDGQEIKDTPRYSMLGNSMAVPVVGWIGQRLADRN